MDSNATNTNPAAAPATPSTGVDAVQLAALQKSQADLLAKLDSLETQAKSAAEAHRNKGAAVPSGEPGIRRGENSMGSRGYSYMKLFGLLANQIPAEHARVELEIGKQLQSIYVDQLGYVKSKPNSVLAPFASELLAQVPGQEGVAKDISEVVKAGITGYDIEEVRRARMKAWGREKALSWLDETAAGVFVPAPVMGELIELLRNNEVLIQAGARVLPLPPNGRIVYPRQTAAGSAYWVGESVAITESQQTTGDVVLMAKKLGMLNKIPNELFRFSAVSVEMFLREDITAVLSLAMDKALLEGVGSQYKPKGLINYANITTHTSTDPGTTTNGYRFQPEDVTQMIAKVEEQNATFRAFVMRPLMYAAIRNRRASAVTANDSAGPFMFDMYRGAGMNLDVTRSAPGELAGYSVFKSTQVAQDRVKNSGTNLSYILGGDFSDMLIALSGAVEFQVSTQGDSPFTTDQTWVRGICLCDGAPRREASFCLTDQLVVG